jgi:AbiU2
MERDLEQEKEFVLAAVLDLEIELRTLAYITNRQNKLEDKVNEIVFSTYGSLIYPMVTSIWHNVILKLYWLYDVKGQRGLRWFLGTLMRPDESNTKWTSLVARHSKVLEKVKKNRDKWVAHRDQEPSKNPEEFWKDGERLTLADAESLSKTARTIIHHDCLVTDATEFGIPKIFEVIEFLVAEQPEIIDAMKKRGIISFHEPEIW